jgi:hypothetical protein
MGPLFGLSLFKQRKSEKIAERGMRACAIGLLGLDFAALQQHVRFLDTQAQEILQADSAAECDFAALQAFFEAAAAAEPVDPASPAIPRPDASAFADNDGRRLRTVNVPAADGIPGCSLSVCFLCVL